MSTSTTEQTKKVSKKTVGTAIVPKVAPAAPAVVAPVEKKSRKPRSPVVAPTPVTEECVAVKQEEEQQQQPESIIPETPVIDGESSEKLSRKKKNYNQLISEVDTLNSLVERYISDHKDVKSSSDLAKFLKTLERGLKRVQGHVQKVGKQKVATTSANVHSGFQKPVRISSQVAEFTGWDVSQPRARVEVTNYVCEYIKSNNLQNPADKRVILADSKLSDLLGYQKEKDGDLNYAKIQKLLAKHYSPIIPVSSA